MAKSSKQKPAAGLSKPLSNAAKAAQRKHVTDYKNSKAKRTAQGNTPTGKGKGKSQPLNATDRAEGSSEVSNNLPHDEPNDVEATPAPKPSRFKRPAIRHVQGSEEVAGKGEPEPTKVSKPVPKTTNFDEEAEPTSTSPPVSSKRKAQEDASDRPRKIDRPPAPGSDSPPGDEESTTGISGNVCEATPSNNSTGGKRKTNATGKGKGKDKPLPVAEMLPTTNPIASGSGAMEETEQPAKRSKKGRQAKKELIDEVDGVVGPTTAPAKKAKVTQKRTKRTQ
ncbi:hypothetical protein RSOLAG22IIIB_06890 [Rhizoctonia solani]|uniref:Uncharacterized protein n=1 Tax=Rhizoctonia solani TaxID=456999 RepID=A0A0K6GHP4_9AGAM|nr:hypothetical protein RSOLAG22IIIB_06890 [Rhizoctonia solani]